jgi:hypothetical protein
MKIFICEHIDFAMWMAIKYRNKDMYELTLAHGASKYNAHKCKYSFLTLFPPWHDTESKIKFSKNI